jgi:hypothetical protein
MPASVPQSFFNTRIVSCFCFMCCAGALVSEQHCDLMMIPVMMIHDTIHSLSHDTIHSLSPCLGQADLNSPVGFLTLQVFDLIASTEV